MRARLHTLWERLRASYWLLPGLMAVGAVGMSLATEALDRAVTFEALEELRWIYGGGPEGARAVLSTIAGSMITVAGVVFSITMVALVLASSQFGPRLLGNFMKDTGNQVVLGTFIATFLYCLLALRSVRGLEGVEFVPHISVTVGLGFGLASLGVLIYFIDHVAASIQAPNVVARVGDDLDAALERAFPEGEEEGEGPLSRPPAEGEGSDAGGEPADRPTARRGGGAATDAAVLGIESGYVQAIDESGLLAAARVDDVTLDLLVRPGDFLLPGGRLARVRPPGEGEVEGWEPPAGEELERLTARVRGAFILGNRRTSTQDPRFVVAQLAEVALRALSPGINDPFTAVNCVDRLGAALSRAVRRPPARTAVRDGDGMVRLRLHPVTFDDLLGEAFDPIREYGGDSTMVISRLLAVLGALGGCVVREGDREALLRHAERAVASGREGIVDEPGLRAVERRFEAACREIRSVEPGAEACR